MTAGRSRSPEFFAIPLRFPKGFLKCRLQPIHGNGEKWEELEFQLVRSQFSGEIAHVNVTKNLSLIAATLGAGLTYSQAQEVEARPFLFQARSVGNYRQISTGTFFEGGTFSIGARDGLVVYEAGCIAPVYFPPLPICPIGATGFVTAGDIDGDGLEDNGSYLSVLSIARAAILRPFQQERVALVAAPPSLLPRPLGGFVNDSRSVFYNIMTTAISQYDISIYTYDRTYMPADRKTFDGEIVPGSYRFSFPSIASTSIPVALSINLFPQLDGFRKINSQNQGLRFTNVRFDGDFAVLNPNVINTITWEGNTISFIAPQADRAYFSIKALVDPNDPLSDPSPGPPIFPNFTGPTVTRVLLSNPLVQSYTLAPNFLIPGETGIVDLEFEILRPTTAVIEDRSIRRFRMPVMVLDPFIMPPPPINGATVNIASADTDGDGVNNFAEWAFRSDRTNAASMPVAPSLIFVNQAPATSEIIGTEEDSNCWEYKQVKVSNPEPKLEYTIERSADMVTWTKITATDPNWKLTDTNSMIKVSSRDPELKGGGFFRSTVKAK